MKYLLILFPFISCKQPKVIELKMSDILWSEGMTSGELLTNKQAVTNFYTGHFHGVYNFRFDDTAWKKGLFFKVFKFRKYLFNGSETEMAWAKANETLIWEYWNNSKLRFKEPESRQPITEFEIIGEPNIEWLDYSDIPDSINPQKISNAKSYGAKSFEWMVTPETSIERYREIIDSSIKFGGSVYFAPGFHKNFLLGGKVANNN